LKRLGSSQSTLDDEPTAKSIGELTNQALRKVGPGKRSARRVQQFSTRSANDTFYANSPYLLPLDTRRPSIRLLRVHPEKRTLDEHLATNQRWADQYHALIAQESSTPAAAGIHNIGTRALTMMIGLVAEMSCSSGQTIFASTGTTQPSGRARWP